MCVRVNINIIYKFERLLADRYVSLFEINALTFMFRYNIEWYMYSIRIQRLILFVLQRAVKSVYLSCGGLLIASLDNFATVKHKNMCQV